jgi:hypothetical protein
MSIVFFDNTEVNLVYFIVTILTIRFLTEHSSSPSIILTFPVHSSRVLNEHKRLKKLTTRQVIKEGIQ